MEYLIRQFLCFEVVWSREPLFYEEILKERCPVLPLWGANRQNNVYSAMAFYGVIEFLNVIGGKQEHYIGFVTESLKPREHVRSKKTAQLVLFVVTLQNPFIKFVEQYYCILRQHQPMKDLIALREEAINAPSEKIARTDLDEFGLHRVSQRPGD